MSRVRVAYLPPRLAAGGAERQMLMLAERLPRDRFEVDFLALVGSGVYDERAAAAGVSVRIIGQAPDPHLRLPSRLWHRASKAFRYVAAVRAARYDIVDAWLYPADVLATLMRPITGTPVVITGRRNVDPQQFFGPFERRIGTLVGQLADVVVANSAAAAANAVDVDGVPPEKMRIIRNGVIVPPEVTPAERLLRRLALGIEDPDEIVIGCVANYLPVKRHAVLIDAFATLLSQPRALRLVLVGDGPLRPALERQILDLGLEKRVRLHGSESDPEPLYGAFDIVVQASAREGLPNALLEAGVAGCAIVATAAGGSAEIVENGRTGLLVPVDDRSALVGALGRLVSDAALRRHLGGAAREHVATTFGVDRFVAEFAGLYEAQVALKDAMLSRRVRR